jgi:2-polyprenyl-6-methoxyphenol hydroxylase-like FAD-dependent oxidoreductase
MNSDPSPAGDLPVLIVGAGPTGLVLALWLTHLGIRVRIVDQLAEPGTTSRALAVQARTLEFYDQIGIAGEVIDGGVQVGNVNIWARGRRAARMPLRRIGEGRSPHPFALIFPQDAHERLLIAQLETHGVGVERRVSLLQFEQHERGVRATLGRPDGSRETCEASYLAGCDGASSTVRQALGIDFPGGTYTGLFYVADVQAAGPPVNDEIHVDLEDAEFLLVFPLKTKGHARLVGMVHEVPGPDRGPLTFEDVRGKAMEQMRLQVEQVNWFSTYRVHHRVAQRLRDRRAFLLGDAAHIHSPVGGQGMNTGIGDAINLAWKLAAVIKGDASPALLDTFEPERIAFARRLVATTDRAFTAVSARGPVARIVRTRLFPLVVPLMPRLAVTRRFLFATVSQTAIEYRGSALSEGVAGGVHGGDRLPWVQVAATEDNFAALRSLRWQVHVYGEARRELEQACTDLGLATHIFAWQPVMARVGLKRGAAYLVRPDGYVALADPQADPQALQRFLRAKAGFSAA